MSSTWTPPDLAGKAALVTGAGGAIAGAMAGALARAGVAVVVADLREESAERTVADIRAAGGRAVACAGDASDPAAVVRALASGLNAFGRMDILINGAGGGHAATTTGPERSFFDLAPQAVQTAFAINYATTLVPCQVLGRHFAAQRCGCILSLASVGGVRPLSRAMGYTNAKAAVVSLTAWLAVHMAREYDPAIRVNAIAPGFVLTEQNRFLLQDPAGGLTPRGEQVLRQVPMGRFADPDEMVGGALWLVSDAARFVTGAVVPIDGGLLAGLGV